MKALPQCHSQLSQKSLKKLESVVSKSFKSKRLIASLLCRFCFKSNKVCKCLGTIKKLNVVKNKCKGMEFNAFENSELIQDVTDLSSSDTSMSGISVISQSPPRRLEGLDFPYMESSCNSQSYDEGISLQSDYQKIENNIALSANYQSAQRNTSLTTGYGRVQKSYPLQMYSTPPNYQIQKTSVDRISLSSVYENAQVNWSGSNSPYLSPLYNTVPLFRPPKKVHNLHKHYLSENLPFQNANHRKFNKFNNYQNNITCSTMSPSSHNTSSPELLLERDRSDPSDFIDLDLINKSDTKSGFSSFYKNSNFITSSPKVSKSINYSDTIYPKKVRDRLMNNSTSQLESFHTWFNGVSPIVNYKQPVLSKPWRNNLKKTFIFSQKEQDSLLSESLSDTYSKISFDESLSSLYNTEYSSQFIDTHCHLDFLFKRMEFQESYQTFKKNNCKTFPKSYEGCISIFCDPQTFHIPDIWSEILEDNEVWSSFGCHPHFANMFTYISEVLLRERLQHPKVMAVGEIGLDYSNKNSCNITVQQKVFRQQLKIALDFQKPLVIHCREASSDCLRIMKEMVPRNYLIHRHCYTSNWSEAQLWMEWFSNIYFGFTPLVTYPSVKTLHETIFTLPLNRILLETDAPYFIPKGYPREKRWSHPGMAIHVAEKIAELKSEAKEACSLEDVLRITRENTRHIYNI